MLTIADDVSGATRLLMGNEAIARGAIEAGIGVARNIQDAWLAFARTGNPSCESIGKWPTYRDRRETMMLGEKCIVEEAPYDEERRAWDSDPNRVVRRL